MEIIGKTKEHHLKILEKPNMYQSNYLKPSKGPRPFAEQFVMLQDDVTRVASELESAKTSFQSFLHS